MKISVLAFLSIIIISSFTFIPTKKAVSFKVDTSKSTITWNAKKVTGEHTGTIKFAGGSLLTDGAAIKSGNFELDLTTITVTDIKDPEPNAKLLKHLKSDDFFSVEKHPVSKFVITSVTPLKNDQYDIKGNLTIKGITNPITFPATVKNSGKSLTASAKVKVDRTKYDIKFRSANYFENLGDKAIYDDFDLDINLVASQSESL